MRRPLSEVIDEIQRSQLIEFLAARGGPRIVMNSISRAQREGIAHRYRSDRWFIVDAFLDRVSTRNLSMTLVFGVSFCSKLKPAHRRARRDRTKKSGP